MFLNSLKSCKKYTWTIFNVVENKQITEFAVASPSNEIFLNLERGLSMSEKKRNLAPSSSESKHFLL